MPQGEEDDQTHGTNKLDSKNFFSHIYSQLRAGRHQKAWRATWRPFLGRVTSQRLFEVGFI
jgi:hypothetical protein